MRLPPRGVLGVGGGAAVKRRLSAIMGALTAPFLIGLFVFGYGSLIFGTHFALAAALA